MSTSPGLKMAGAAFDLLFGVDKDVAFRVEFVDTNSDPVDISAMTWEAKLRSSPGGSVLATIPVTPGADYIDCSLAAATTATLPRRCVWSLAETADGDRPVLSGSVTVTADGDGGVVGGSSDTATVVFTANTVEVLGVVLSGGVSGTGVDVSSGTSDPSSTPTSVGDIYIDTSGRNTWQAVGTANSADWIQTNGGGGAAELADLTDVNSATDTSGFVLVGDGTGFDSRALTSTDVGLGSVDNTADADKPISDLTVTALSGKSATGHGHDLGDVSDSGALAPLDTVGTSEVDDEAVTLAKLAHVSTNTVLGRDTASTGDVEEMSVSTTKSMLSLDLVENTADADKVVSDATVTALAGKEDTTDKGAAGGYASLDGSSLVPDAQIPGGITRDSEMSAAITVAIDALLDGAPAALDTLNELAAALDNDDDFHTAVTNALAGKQPLDSDLTSIAALTTTAFGRSLLIEASGTTTRTTIGLGSVDNTADADKPISDLTVTALAGKSATGHGHDLSDVSDSGALAPLDTVSVSEIDDEAVTPAKLAHVATDTILGRTTATTGDVEVLTAGQARGVLSVDNTDNTADADKPISTATSSALADKLDDDFSNGDSGAQTDDKYLKADGVGGIGWAVASGTGGVTELSDLSDVNSSTDTNGFALVADGSGFDARALVKGDVGLGSVDNTTDAGKPISSLTQTEIDTKQDTTTELDDLSDVSAVTVGHVAVVNGTQTGYTFEAPGSGGATELSDLTDVNSSTDTNGFVLVGDGSGFDSRSLTSGDVGLGNVDNTADADKPISDLTVTALAGKSGTGHGHDLSDVSDSGALAPLDTVSATEIDDEAVTPAKLAHVATNTLLGRDTATTGDVEVLSVSTAKSMLSLDLVDNTADDDKPVSTATSAAIAGHTDFADDVFTIHEAADPTALLAFDVSLVAPATTRTITIPNTNINLRVDGFGTFLVGNNDLDDLADLPTALTNLGLDAVDNTADADKPISDLTVTALAGKSATGHGHDLGDVSDSGDLAALDTVSATEVDDEAITLPKLAHVATDSFLGRDTATTGDVEVLSVSTAKSMLSVDLVENIADADKVVSDLTVTALAGKHDTTTELDDLDDVSAVTVGFIPVVNGTQTGYTFQSNASGAGQLDELSDVNTAVDTSGFVLVGDGSGFDARALVKGDTGLGNVDNTADADKVISDLTVTALAGKSGTGHGHDLSDVSDSGALAPLDTVTSTEIDDEAVTLAKMADMAENTVIGRLNGSGTGAPVAMTDAETRTAIGAVAWSATLQDIIDGGTPGVDEVLIGDGSNYAVRTIDLGDLSDVGSTDDTLGNVLIGDGSGFDAGPLALTYVTGVGDLGPLDTVTSTEIDDEAVTLPKLAHVATDRILGRDTASTGDVEVLDAAAVLGIIGVTSGAEPNGVASDTVSGEVELADVTETNAGSATNRALMPDSFAGSRYGSKDVSFAVFGSATSCAVGNGTTPIVISSTLAGMNIVEVVASVHTAGTTGTMDVQVRRRRGATDADVLSTKATIDTTEHSTVTAAAAPVVDGASDDLAAGDLLFVDVDVVHSTAALGLSVTVVCRMP